MRSLRERWRVERPETVILAGCVLAFGGNYGLLAWTIWAAPPEEWAGPVSGAAIGIALAILTAWTLSRGSKRTARRFGWLGLAASAILLLNWPGVVGGGVALVGAVWGILTSYEGH